MIVYIWLIVLTTVVLRLWYRSFDRPIEIQVVKTGQYFVNVEGFPDPRMPTRGTKRSTCYDLYAQRSVTINPEETTYIPTGVILKLPKGIDCHIHARSSHRKLGLDCLGTGIIDSDYRNEFGVLLHNHSDMPHTIVQGDRCGQMEFTRVLNVRLVTGPFGIDMTERGKGGWGSTGR